MTYSEAANLALNQTLVRSINTSIIALLPVAAILVVGVGLPRRRHAEGPRARAVRRHRRRHVLLDLHRDAAAGASSRSASPQMKALAKRVVAPALAQAARRTAAGKSPRAGAAAAAGRRPRVVNELDVDARRRRRQPTSRRDRPEPPSTSTGHAQPAQAQGRGQPPGARSAGDAAGRRSTACCGGGSATSRTGRSPAWSSRTSRRCSPTPRRSRAVVDGLAGAVTRPGRSTWSPASRRAASSSARRSPYALGAGFVPVRKAGKLPGDDCAPSPTTLEYGTATLEVQADAVRAGRPGPGRRRRAGDRRHGRGHRARWSRAPAPSVVGLRGRSSS